MSSSKDDNDDNRPLVEGNHGNSDDDNDEGEQIRVSFVLDPSVADRSLTVPSEPIAVPSSVRRKGLSAVINHLLDRKVTSEDDESDDSENSDSDDDDEEKLPAISFDFLMEQKLLRTGVETAARRYGLSLEQAVRIIYFPAQTAPKQQGETEEYPDWISAMSYSKKESANTNNKSTSSSSSFLCTGGYDGSIRVHRADSDGLTSVATGKAHQGPIKCLTTRSNDQDETNNNVWIATGSLDHTLAMHVLDTRSNELTLHTKYSNGHTSSIGCVDLLSNSGNYSNSSSNSSSSNNGGLLLASGDWEGGICIWDSAAESMPTLLSEERTKKQRKMSGSSSKSSTSTEQETVKTVAPKAAWNAHVSQISGVSWGKDGGVGTTSKTLVTGSWDHSIKVWDVERQDCLLTLNGSRVVSCLDTSYHSPGVVATGHPDCTIRLWDVRTNATKSGSTTGGAAAVVSDSTLRPSHKAWVSAVQWSPTDPYILASTSHDGTIKIWDIRSSLPLYTVKAHSKEEKGLCLAYGSNGVIYTGGTDRIVKQYVS